MKESIPGVNALRRHIIEHLAGILRRATSSVHLDEFGEEELVGGEAIDADVDMDLTAGGEGARAGAGGEEGGEGGGIDGDATELEVVEDGEAFAELAETGQALEVVEDDVRVLGVEGQECGFGEFGG